MLTRESILAMEPGRELDALVEQYVFGNVVIWTQDDITDPYPVSGQGGYGFIVGHYSTDISEAWEVFEKIKDQGAWIEVAWNPRKQRYRALIGANNVEGMSGVDTNSETAPLAICRAALLTTISGEDSQ